MKSALHALLLLIGFKSCLQLKVSPKRIFSGENWLQAYGEIGFETDYFKDLKPESVLNFKYSYSPRFTNYINYDHTEPGFVTFTSTITRSRKIRVTTTSDIWVSTVQMVYVTVTQLTRSRDYVAEYPNTVTSLLRVTRTPVIIATRTREEVKHKTLVPTFTKFGTFTRPLDFWLEVTHLATDFEVNSIPIFETSTLFQIISETTTVWRTKLVTSTRQPLSYYGY